MNNILTTDVLTTPPPVKEVIQQELLLKIPKEPAM